MSGIDDVIMAIILAQDFTLHWRISAVAIRNPPAARAGRAAPETAVPEGHLPDV
jgi:hypothetical protein